MVLVSSTSRTQSSLVAHATDLLVQVGPLGSWVTYDRMQVVFNAVIVAPVSFVGTAAFPRSRWQDWTAYAFLGAVVVETFQGVALPARTASFGDVVANTAGALLGALVYRWWPKPRG